MAALPAATTTGVVVGTGEAGKGLAGAQHSAGAACTETRQRLAVTPQQQDVARKAAAAAEEGSVSVPAGDAVRVTAAVTGSVSAPPAATTAAVVVGTEEAGKGLAAAEPSAAAAEPQQMDVDGGSVIQKDGAAQAASSAGVREEKCEEDTVGKDGHEAKRRRVE
jgi:hypothetical protein